MKFYKKLIRTFNDLPNHTTLLIHSLAGCNLHCYGCHNYEEIVAKKQHDFFTSENIIEHLKLNGYLFDAVLFSGGEFLIEEINTVSSFLTKIRNIFEGKIVINTNGSFPEKIIILHEQQLVDGFHIDMKLPYHLLNIVDDQEIFKSVIGIKPTQEFIDKLLQSIELVIKYNSPLSQVRTVKYPILDNSFFVEIERFIISLNQKYNSHVPYQLNDFYNINE